MISLLNQLKIFSI